MWGGNQKNQNTYVAFFASLGLIYFLSSAIYLFSGVAFLE